jgi:hypothetical protein
MNKRQCPAHKRPHTCLLQVTLIDMFVLLLLSTHSNEELYITDESDLSGWLTVRSHNCTHFPSEAHALTRDVQP